MTRNGVPSPSTVPTSLTRATYSLLTRAAMRASRRKRSTASVLRLASGSRNFMATRCASPTCVAATTMPMPPSPMTSSTRYLSATRSPGLGSKRALRAGTAITPSRRVGRPVPWAGEDTEGS